VTHALRVFNIYCISRQHLLRKRIELLCYAYSVSSVQCYVPLLCTFTVCSVYREPSVIICSSALILPTLSVIAVRFEMQYLFCTRALRAQCQYKCNTMCGTQVFIRTYRAHVLYTCIHSICSYRETN